MRGNRQDHCPRGKLAAIRPHAPALSVVPQTAGGAAVLNRPGRHTTLYRGDQLSHTRRKRTEQPAAIARTLPPSNTRCAAKRAKEAAATRFGIRKARKERPDRKPFDVPRVNPAEQRRRDQIDRRPSEPPAEEPGHRFVIPRPSAAAAGRPQAAAGRATAAGRSWAMPRTVVGMPSIEAGGKG